MFGLLPKVRTGEQSKTMRKVTVNIPEVHISYITLEVDDDTSDEDIKDKANDMLEAGDYRDMLEYSHTMDKSLWDVTNEAGEWIALCMRRIHDT